MRARSMVRRSLAAVGLAACIAVAPPCVAQGALPTVQTVMHHYVGALGGRGALNSHTAMTVHSTITVSDQPGAIGHVARYKGMREADEIVLPDGRRALSGYDGAVAWGVSPAGEPTVVDGAPAKSAARDADMHYPAHIPRYFTSMRVLGVSQFAGHTCYHIQGTTKWGNVNEQFYDTASGLLIGYHFNSKWRGGPGDESVVFSDYKPFGNWLVATRVEGKQPGRTITEVVQSVTFDDVSDSMVAVPAAVKSVIARRAP